MKFDKSNVTQIRNELEAALAEVAKRHGLEVRIGNIKYSSDKIDAPLTVTTKLDETDPLSPFPSEYVAEGKRWSHSAALIGATMVSNNGSTGDIIVVGVKPRTGGKQIIFTMADGKNKMFKINYIDFMREYTVKGSAKQTAPKLIITKTN